MIEGGSDIYSRLSLPDIRQISRSAFARIAAIALIGSSALLSRHIRTASASPIDFPTDSSHSYYETASKHDITRDDHHVDENTYTRVMVCFESDSPNLAHDRAAYIDDVKGQSTSIDDSQHHTDVDVQFVSDTFVHVPCAEAVVTDRGYTLLENNQSTTALSGDVEMDVADNDRVQLSGDLAHYVGSTYAESHGITGKGQRVGVIGTGGNFDTTYASYRQALEARSGCVGTTYVQDNLFSGCPGGESRVIADYAGKVYSRDLISAGHEDTVGQMVHAVAPDAHIVHLALNTIKREPDGEQLVLFGSDVVRAIDEAIELDVDSVVISLAVAGAAPDNCSNFYTPFNEAQARANKAGIPLFISTGNSSVVSWPACVRQPGVYPITTVRYTGEIPSFAGYQDDRVLAARGEDALVVNLYGSTQLTSGTSFAAPVAAGLYTLWQSTDLSYSPVETMNLLKRYSGVARAQNGDIVPNLNFENLLRQPQIARRLGIYFTALLPHLMLQR